MPILGSKFKTIRSESFSASRNRVRRELYADERIVFSETAREIVSICKGVNSKKHKAHIKADTIGTTIRMMRFPNSRLTCVCKSRAW